MYVAANPDAYVDSYFAVNYVHVYTTTPGSAPPPSSALSSVLPVASTSSATSGGAEGRTTTYTQSLWPPSTVTTSTSTSPASSSTPTSSAPATTASCPTSDNKVVASGGKNFMIECGVDHQGGDLTFLAIETFQQCIDACAQNSECVDVSLYENVCYLKSVLGAPVQKSGVFGAKLFDNGPSSTFSTTTAAAPSQLPSGAPTDAPQSSSGSEVEIVLVTQTITASV